MIKKQTDKYPLKTVTTNETYTHILEHDKVYHSSFNNISSCLKVENLEKIINNVINNPELQTEYRNRLQECLRNNNFFDNSILAKFNDILERYNNDFIYSRREDFERFVNDYKTGEIDKYFNVHYSIGERSKTKDKDVYPEIARSIYIDFNVETFNGIYNIHENWHETETAFRHLFVLSLILNVIENNILNVNNILNKEQWNFYNRLCRCVRNCAGLSIISGLEFSTEFDIGSPYGELYEELVQLSPLKDKEMVFAYTPENRSFDITIKDYRFLSDAYAAWWNNAWTERDIKKRIKITTQEEPYEIKKKDVMIFDSDEFTDTQDISTIRIIQGQKPNTISVTVKLTGMRIISRIMDASGNAKEKVYFDKLAEYLFVPDGMMACLLWRIFWRTEQYQNKFKDMKKSYHNTYLKFIKGMEGNNDKVAKSAVIILLSQKSKEEREKFIKSHPMNERTKKQITEGLNKLDRMLKHLNKGKKAELIKFLWGLKKYVW